MRPSQVFRTLEVERSEISRPLCREGTQLSMGDRSTVLDVYEQWLLLLLDLGYLPPDDLQRTIHRLLDDMSKVDVLVLCNSFAESLQRVYAQDLRGFKALCSTISTHLYPLIKDDVQKCASGSVFAAKRLIQVFAYITRLSLRDIDLTQQMLTEYLRVEESIPDTYPEDIVKSLNRIVKAWFGSFIPGDINPSHGPGGVAEHGRCSLETKYNTLATDQRLEYALGDPIWVTETCANRQLNRTSKTIFVAKSYKTFRTISMEPTTLQYFQQGIWRLIDRYVHGHRYLSKRIDFRDQTRNRMLAQIGSGSRDYATLDLSSASDSVSYQLVKRLFKGTWLLRYIVTLRSTKTSLPDGRVIDMKKFAPMGSALCFPIETILFASICEMVTRAHHRAGDYSVYGDDIIVPSACAEEVMDVLGLLGFRVNLTKSFYKRDSWFRESCGGEFICGYDVTPMRVSRKYAHKERLERLASLIDLANTAFVYKYKYLRHFFLQKLQKEGYHALFGETSVLSDSPTNYQLKQRWNSNLQRLEVLATAITAKPSKKELDSQNESIRYRHWLESTVDRSAVEEGFESVICRPMVRAMESWTSKPYIASDQREIDSHSPAGTATRG